MEVRIAVQNTNHEIVFETAATADQITKEVEAAVKNKTLLSLLDDKGKKILVPGESIAFVEIGASEQRRVGFAVNKMQEQLLVNPAGIRTEKLITSKKYYWRACF